jgi:hypothetical protein
LTQGRTTLAIAHRLTTLRDANRILVFDKGKLMEEGSHAQLLALDGHYARLVKIQSQLSSDATIDTVLDRQQERQQEPAAAAAPDPDRCLAGTPGEHAPRWLDAGGATFRLAAHSALELAVPGEPVVRGVFAVSLFPAVAREKYISLRTWDREGHEHELGILRDLPQWSDDVQRLVREALDRRYFMHVVRDIDGMELEFGYLTVRARCENQTPPRTFVMRWSQSQAQDFGSTGKMLIDLEDNRYLVRDVEALPRKQRELFQRYIYW